MTLSSELLSSFARIAGMDGGRLELLDEEGGRYRFGYTPGVPLDCSAGACVLPHVELQTMMREWLLRRDPEAQLVVELHVAEQG